MPRIATVRRFSSPVPTDRRSATMRGSTSRGTPNSARSSSSQSSVSRLTSSVRDAFVTSITCCSPPVNRQTRKLSTVPNARPSLRAVLAQQPLELRRREVRVGYEPGLAADRAPGRARGSARRSAGPATRSPARPACPSRGPRASVVSRWFVIADHVGRRPGVGAPAGSTLAQISSGSCSTQPGRGKCWGSSR